MQTKNQIAKWMRANVVAHIDMQTNEVDATGLAEDWDRACAGGVATLDNPDHIAWEVAAEMAGRVTRGLQGGHLAVSSGRRGESMLMSIPSR